MVLQFIAKQPQNLWEDSPLYTSLKFAGTTQSEDLTITPTNGILQVLKSNIGQIIGNTISITPNPVVDEVTIAFEVNETTQANLSISDVVGRKLITIINGQLPNGTYTYVENLGSLERGLYLVTLTMDNGETKVSKIVKQ